MDTIGLTIAEVRALPIELPLEQPIETAAGTMVTSPLVMLDIRTRQGVVGHAYVRCYTSTAMHPLASLIVALGPLLSGTSAAPQAAGARLRGHFSLLGVSGLVGMALAGIDVALWDARARATGLPLAVLLGGTAGQIPTYATLPSMDPTLAAGQAEKAVGAGFGAIKVKLGGATLTTDLAMIGAVRSAVGDRIALLADYNQSLTVPEALMRIAALDDLGLHWIEEPTRADDLDGHARIAASVRTPLQLGENWGSGQDVARAAAARACGHVMFDLARIGGIGGWQRAAAVAENAGLPISSHAYPEVSAHLLAATSGGHLLEYATDTMAILQDPMPVRGGQAVLSERPGVGLEWNESAVSRLLDR